MYTLFDITEKDRRHSIVIPKFNHVDTVIGKETQKVQDYYRFHKTHLPSNHLLVKLILNLNVSLNREVYEYVSTVEDRVDKLAKSFKFIHPTNTNVTTFDGVFYNENTVEYIIASDEAFDVDLAWKKWRSIVAVKIHSHPFTDMSIAIPNGKYPLQMTKGAAVISINIPMLALQYKAWVRYEQNRGVASESIQNFIYNFVLNNMVKRHTEICLINRTISYITQLSVSEFSRQHPFHVTDYTGKVDEVLISRDKYLTKRKVGFNQLFLVYKPLYFKTWAQVLSLPKIAPTRQVSWVWLLSYLPYILFYLKVINKQNSKIDRGLAFEIKRHIGYLENTRAIPVNLDSHTNVKLQELKDILQITKA